MTVPKKPVSGWRGGGGSGNNGGVLGGCFFKSAWIFGLVNGLGCVISLLTGSHLHLDLLGTGAFGLAALPTFLQRENKRVRISAGAVMLWSAKLASFLFYRVLRTQHDARLDDTLSTASGTVSFWFVSFLWGIFCSLPHTIGANNHNNKYGNNMGLIMYFVGLLVETTADCQKWVFKQNHPGRFCNVGLWKTSQHPNFFGNLLLWTGILVYNMPALTNAKSLALAALSPIFMTALFSGQAYGYVTNAVELSMKRYGSDPAFLTYVETVPKIIPNPFLLFKSN